MNSRFLRIFPVMKAAFLLNACSQDELAEQTGILPEGKYPLQIGSVGITADVDAQPWSAGASQTRVSENTDNMSSKWDGGEAIHVKLGNQETTYEVMDANGSLNLTGEQLYWTKHTDNVTAWYTSSETDGTINLANQSNGLAYVSQATVENTSCDNPQFYSYSCKSACGLFRGKHVDLTNASVSILAPTSCTVNNGVVTPSSTEYIPMHKTIYNDGKVCYEANVTPNLALKDKAFHLVVGDKTVDCSTTEVLTQMGQLYVITLQVNEKVTEININDITKTEYTVSDNVHLEGKGQTKKLKLTVEAGAKLIIEDVNHAPTTDGNAITCKGDATITLKGNNTLIGRYAEGSGGYSGIL